MRRGQLIAVGSCLAGAALTLYAVTRVWTVRVESRPGLSDLRTEQTGADLQPWLIGLAVVALAGSGALLATRGRARRVLGVLLTLAGAGIAVGAVLARTGIDPGAAGFAGSAWPVACVLGGAVVAVGGVLAARHGHLWAAMSARYERRPAGPSEPDAGSEPDAVAVPGAPAAPSPNRGQRTTPEDSRAFWDALDRGDDPTDR